MPRVGCELAVKTCRAVIVPDDLLGMADLFECALAAAARDARP